LGRSWEIYSCFLFLAAFNSDEDIRYLTMPPKLNPENKECGSQEIGTCSFCRAEKPVMRQYLHAKNKPKVGDGFDFIRYCADCGLSEIVLKISVEQSKTDKLTAEEEKEIDALHFPWGKSNGWVEFSEEKIKACVAKIAANREKKGYERGKADWKATDFAKGLYKKQAETNLLDEFERLIASEMLICQKEGTPTSRLTSLYGKIRELRK